MRRAVRAIIINNDNILVLHRNKFGEEYDTLPGGNIELHETPEAALKREVFEETSVDFKNPRLVFVEPAGVPYGNQYIYLCDYVSGEPALQPGSEEHLIHELGKNLYIPRWLPLAEMPSSNFLSSRLRDAILDAVEKGFPKEPVELR